MIATDLQYAITQDRIRRFDATLARMEGDETVRFRELHIRAILDEIDALEDALATYDELTSGGIEAVEVARLADLPSALVRARLVAGLDQAELAGVTRHPLAKIQRWERDGYSQVPLRTMLQIAEALPLSFKVNLTKRAMPRAQDVKRALRSAGLPPQIFDRIIIPGDYPAYAQDDEIDRRLNTLFGFGAIAAASGKVFETAPLRFKLPGNAAQSRTRAYAAYVEGLCALVAKTQLSPPGALPRSIVGIFDWLFPTGEIELAIATRQCWAAGIGVLPLRDSVAFHGACRRAGAKATIALKQSTRHHSRWLFDLLHEIYHLIHDPDDFTLLEAEETSSERRLSDEEQRANRFAGFVLTRGRLIQAIEGVINLSGGRIQRLLSAVNEVAQSFDIPVAILANLVAENVQTSTGRNWWPTATNLQPDEPDPWKVVRDVFITEADFGPLDASERTILRQCLETNDE